MTQRVLEAQKWTDDWLSECQRQGITGDELASLLFVAAALQRRDEGRCLMDLCVDAGRKLGCNHSELAFVLGGTAQRLTMVKVGQQYG